MRGRRKNPAMAFFTRDMVLSASNTGGERYVV
jgi:hypothetical protein